MRHVLLFFISVTFLTACNQPEPELPSPEQIVANSAERMISLDGFKFSLDVSGTPAFLDPDKNFSLSSAEGFFVAPDKAIAEVKVLAPGLVTQVNILSDGEEQWLSGLVSDEWAALPAEWGFNPATLLDMQNGIISILTRDLSDLQHTGTSKLEGGPNQELYELSGILDGGRINELSQGLFSQQSHDIQLWIAPESYELYRAVITEKRSTGEDEPTVWQIDFREFDKTVEISPPTP